MTLPLPILEHRSSPSSADLVRMFRRAQLHWHQHLAEEIPCDVGTALASPSQPAFNVLLDAALPDNLTAPSAFAAVQSAFSTHGGCRRWIMNPSAPADRTRPLIDHLLQLGWIAHTQSIFCLNLASLPPQSALPAPIRDLKILPARAALSQTQDLANQAAVELNRPSQAAAAMLHLDDGHYDPLIALVHGRPAARIGVLAVGDVGLIKQLHVLKPFRSQGLGRLLLHRAIEIAVRSQFRHLFMAADSPCPLADHLLPDAGFRNVGEFAVYAH